MSNADKMLEKFGQGEFLVEPFDIEVQGMFIIHVEKLLIRRNGETRTTANFCGQSEFVNPEIFGYDKQWYELSANAVKGFTKVLNGIKILKD